MVFTKNTLYALLPLALSLSTHALPLERRIAQVIADSTAKWEQACLAAGGAQQCNPISQQGFTALLAAGGDCDQQNAADAMVTLAKTLNNDPNMIKFAQIFAQQPRNSPNKQSVNYCQQQPKNAELNGLFQCQFQGVDPQTFTGGVKVGAPGTIPLGLNAPLDPSGSCKANPQGPIADGTQLVDLTQDPGVGAGGAASGTATAGNATAGNDDSGAANAGNSTGTANAGSDPSDDGDTSFPADDGSDNSGSDSSDSGADNSGDNSDSGADNSGSADSGSDSGSAANSGADNSGSDSGSAANSGADSSGSDSGSNSSSSNSATSGADASCPSTPTVTVTVTASSATSTASASGGDSAASSGAGGFKEQNGKDAQALNAKFANLSASSSCTDGDQACVGGAFAQCVGGKFATTQCAGGTQCFALPLVNKAGTSITCTTESDAAARIQATGATGGITGN